MPIISEGYASTNFQGGKQDQTAQPKVQIVIEEVPEVEFVEENDAEKSLLKFSPTSTTSTTPRPVRRSTTTTQSTTATTANSFRRSTTTTTSKPPTAPSVNPYFPVIPEPDQHYFKDHHLKNSEDLQLKNLQQDQYELEKLGNQEQQVFNVQLSSSFGGQPSNNGGIKGSVEEVPLFADFTANNNYPSTTTEAPTTTTTTTTPSPFILQPGDDGVYEDVQTGVGNDDEVVLLDSDQYVRFVASPPSKINIAIPPRGSPKISSQEPSNTHYKPPPTVPDSPFYQAGYQQLDDGFPLGSEGPAFPDSVDPRLVDPNVYHEDRPNFGTGKQPAPGENFYPLGKAPPKQEEKLPEILGIPPNKPVRPKPLKPAQKKKQSTSIFDFLIPSFLSGRADPEGPPKPQAEPQQPQQPQQKTLSKLPVPNRPPNTFPQPEELGGRLNPILIKVPGGFPPMSPPQHAFPKPPTLQDWQQHQQKVLASRSNRPVQAVPTRAVLQDTAQPNGLVKKGVFVVDEVNEIDEKKPKLKLPRPPPPMADLAAKVQAPLPMTSQPLIGLPRVPPGRKQAPFLSKQPLRPPLVKEESDDLPITRKRVQLPALPPPPLRRPMRKRPIQVNNDYVKPTTINQDSLREYLAKLNDPEFVQNLTKARVYHDKELHQPNIQRTAANIGDQVTYIQDSNPFYFRNKPLKVVKEFVKPTPAYNPALDEIAPPSKPIRTSGVTKPEITVVYRPVQTREPIRNPQSTTTTTTTTKTTTTTTTTTTTEDPVAAQVSLLLQQYLAASADDKSGDVPSLLYDPENNAVVLEYETTTGATTTTASTSDSKPEASTEASTTAANNDNVVIDSEDQIKDILLHDEGFATYLTHLDDSLLSSFENTIPEERKVEGEVTLDQVFQPSAQPEESEWFVLNENGQRERPMTAEEIADVKRMLSDHSTETEPEQAEETNPIELTGGFLPIEGANPAISDQVAS